VSIAYQIARLKVTPPCKHELPSPVAAENTRGELMARSLTERVKEKPAVNLFTSRRRLAGRNLRDFARCLGLPRPETDRKEDRGSRRGVIAASEANDLYVFHIQHPTR